MKSKIGLSDRATQKSLTYWAAAPSENIADEILEKVRQYYLFLFQSGRLDLYEKVYQMYYGPALQGAQVAFTGQQGELVTITVNDFRNLIKRLITLVTSDRLSFECRATNTDHKSQAQTILGQGLLEYYLREKKLEVYHDNATELAMLYADAYVSVEWNATLGDAYAKDPETNEMMTSGDIEYRYYSPLDMVKDPVQTDPFHSMWKCKLDWTNKFELAAKFPEFYERIVNLEPDFDIFVDYSSNLIWQARQGMFGDFISDEIPLFVFYHDKCKTLPEGRMVWCLADGTTLIDGPLPYSEVPVYRISPGEWLGTPFGYSLAFDMMPVQEMKDALHSTICTNQNAFGVQNIYAQKGSGIEVTTLRGGMNLFEGSGDPPTPLQLTQSAPETFTYLEALDAAESRLSGINEVAQGNPKRDMSGQAMALLQSMAIQFSQDLQKSYVRLFEDSGTATLDRLKTYATVPRVAAIAGKANRKYMKEFIGADIEGINRVLVSQGNPIMNTMAGKQWLAEFMTGKGIIKTPEEIITVMTTGRAEPIYQNEQSELMNIHAENEMLQEGSLPQVLLTDNPLLHIKEHAAVGNSPEARNDAKVMQAYTTHIQSHLANWKGGFDPVTGQFLPPMDPDLANLLGIPAPPQPMMGLPAMGGQPAPQPGKEQGGKGKGKEVPKGGSPMAAPVNGEDGPTAPNPSQPPPGTPMENQQLQ